MFKKGKAAKDDKETKASKEDLAEIKRAIEGMTKTIEDKEKEIAQKNAKANALREEAKDLLRNNDKNGAARKMKLMQNIMGEIETMSKIVQQHASAMTSLHVRKEQIELKLSAKEATTLLEKTTTVNDKAIDLLGTLQEHEQLNEEFLNQLGMNDKSSAFVDKEMAELMAELDAEKFVDIPSVAPAMHSANEPEVMVEI